MHTIAAISAFLVQLCGSHAAVYAHYVVQFGERYEVDPRIVASMMLQESSCDPNATGALGELGLMQIKRGTRATAGYDHLSDEKLREPRTNIMLGVRYLRRCLEKCAGSIAGALSLYKGIARKGGVCRDSVYARDIMARIAES